MTQLINEKALSIMESVRQKALDNGAFRAEMVDVSDISTEAAFRSMCESNACGNFGRNYKCPPDIGTIEELMAQIKTYDKALIYQTVGELEDSYDFEGMMEIGEKHNQLVNQVWDYTDELLSDSETQIKDVLHLGAGGCTLCSVCGKVTGEPCRNPKRAKGSLEAYGINVSRLAKLAGMRYINGTNTVTYFAAVFYRVS